MIKMNQENKEKTIINCRKTGNGASTTVVEEFDSSIRILNRSKSGNHWDEEVTFMSNDAYVIVQDISNSQKHRCYKLCADGTTISASCREDDCPL